MKERLKDLHQLQKFCKNELQQVPSNAEEFFINMDKFAEQLEKNWRDDYHTLNEFDSLVTSITTIMDCSRQLNLQLQLHSKRFSEFFIDSQNDSCKKTCSNFTSITSESKKFLYPAEEFDNKEDEGDLFKYPKLMLNEFYKEGTTLNAIITYIKDLDNFNFYIFDKSSPYRECIVELSKSLDLRQYHNLPPSNEIFGVVLEQHIFRAVRNIKIFYDEEMENEICPVYLLDTGEIVPLSSSEHLTYKLNDKQKAIPGLALPCILNHSKKNPFLDVKTVQKALKELENKECLIKVIRVESNCLYVELPDNYQSLIDNIEGNCSNKKADIYKKITEEELEILYEEPLSTSNAMKAVMGYDPQDDKRICRFYNPKTGICFKGSNCKLEHTLRQPDGWTKDILPSATIVENLHPIIFFPAESIINITPTYIERMDRFYAQVNDPNDTSPPLVWSDEDIPSRKRLQKPPHMFELVLSRYVDGLWYRAKIISHDDDYKMFKVFYVDYGNHQVVHLKELAFIDDRKSKIPFKAVLCRIAAVRERKNISTEDREKCIQLLCEMILNKSVDVKVLSHYEDLFISFINKKDYPIPEILIEKKYVCVLN